MMVQLTRAGMDRRWMQASRRMAHGVLAALLLLLTNCGTASEAQTIPAGVQRLTTVNEMAGTGYFVDPLPIHLDASKGSYIPSLSGTTKQILNCSSLAPTCYSAETLTITASTAIKQQALNAGSTLAPFDNMNVYQDNAGDWQMAVTAYVKNSTVNPNNNPWTVILHASPNSVTQGQVPTSWTADTLLVGSFAAIQPANYDGKYIEDGANLYLIYSKRLPASTQQDGIVAQAMTSATQVSSSSTVTLLAPENNGTGGYNSEYFDCLNPPDQFKLIETGNIAVIGGKYAMAYSTGRYNKKCYKAGVAWSDFLLGPYKKILQPDTNGVWLEGNGNQEEVVYLMQAQLTQWPNYTSAVLAPGVPSLVDYQGTWYMYFAAFDPTDAPPDPTGEGTWDGSHRRPYFIRLNQAVPQNGATVAGTSNENLVRWLTLATQ